MIAKAAGFQEIDNRIALVPYYYNSLQWAIDKEIIFNLTNFQPDSFCSRELFIVLLYNWQKDNNIYMAPTNFKDWNSVSSWGRKAIAWAINNNIIKSTDLMIRPKENCLYNEAIEMLINKQKI